MDIVKTLDQIAWNVPEKEYRKDPALSYSTLARYEREGFNNLSHLFDHISTPSLTYGSIVDCLLTDGMDAFNEQFVIKDIKITDSGIKICQALVNDLKATRNPLDPEYPLFTSLSPEYVSEIAKQADFWKGDKWDKVRYREVLKTGDIADYYNSLTSQDKTVITQKDYDEAIAAVDALKTSPATSFYFKQDTPFSPIKRYYQLKFKATLDGIDYRSMMDLAIVDYENKVIIPCDLKTSSHKEWDFFESFKKWRYDIQARLYAENLATNLNKDDYFKDFTIQNYRFIVVNRETLTPLVWEFKDTFKDGTLQYGDTTFRDPKVIGKELSYYLKENPNIPLGIYLEKPNDIVAWLNKQ